MISRRLCTRLKEKLINTRQNKLVDCNMKADTNLSWLWRVFYSSPGEQPSRTRASSLALSERSTLRCPGAGCYPALTPPAKSIKRKDQYKLLNLTNTRVLELFDSLLSKACVQASASPVVWHFPMKPGKYLSAPQELL